MINFSTKKDDIKYKNRRIYKDVESYKEIGRFT